MSGDKTFIAESYRQKLAGIQLKIKDNNFVIEIQIYYGLFLISFSKSISENALAE